MATIKSYTDISQSKKLAEILPLESADMIYIPIMDIDSMSNSGFLETPECYPYSDVINCYADYLPCWSLAALLDILYQVKEIKHQRVTILVGGFAGQQWYVEFVKVQDEKSVLLEHSKELVDACYEMIIKLHELNLL